MRLYRPEEKGIEISYNLIEKKMSETKPILGYWDARGLGQAIRLLLTYAGVDFIDKRYTVGPPPNYDRSQWLNDKYNLGLDFPNVSSCFVFFCFCFFILS